MGFDLGSALLGGGVAGLFGGGGEEEAPSFLDLLSQLPEAAQIGMDTTKQIAPQQAQMQLDLLRQYGLPIAQEQQQAFSQMYPETAGLPEYLAKQVYEGSQAGLTKNEQRIINDAVRANLGEQAVSPTGTNRLSAELLAQTRDRQSQFLNLGQNLSSRVPLYQAQTPQYTDYASQISPGFVVTGQQQQQAQQYAQQNQPSGLGSFIQGALPLAATMIGGPAVGAGTSAAMSMLGGSQQAAGLQTFAPQAAGGNSWGIQSLTSPQNYFGGF